ncbi:Hydrogenase transcriptional regulatory protein hupR1 [Thalassocella blandensis]|nr:Hydrogenase transcriptional regulatory protein hupR1 [Thalassocella blandensis]
MSNVDQCQPNILFVDDEEHILKAFKRLSRGQNWRVQTTTNPKEALKLVSSENIDVVISDMQMPEMDGAEFLKNVRNIHPQTGRVLVTGFSDMKALGRSVNDAAINNYIEKPWDDETLKETINQLLDNVKTEKNLKLDHQKRVSISRKLGRLNIGLEKKLKESKIEIDQALHLLYGTQSKEHRVSSDLLSAMFNSIDLLNQKRRSNKFVADVSAMIGEKLGLKDAEVDKLRIAGMFHNIGIIASENVRQQQSNIWQMDAMEKARYQSLVSISASIMNGLPSLSSVADVILKHKEKLDGSGYPVGLKNEEVPIECRILGLVSDFELLYDGQLVSGIKGFKAAIGYLKKYQYIKYDAKVLHCMSQCVNEAFIDKYLTILTKEQHQLLPGMMVAKDVLSHSKSVLLPAGTLLSFEHIEQLRKYEQRTKHALKIDVRQTTN